jgi:hypothetical protein
MRRAACHPVVPALRALALLAALALPAALGARSTGDERADREDPTRAALTWRTGNRAWLEPMIFRGIAGERLGVDGGFFAEEPRKRAKMSPNHEAEWRSLRYLAAVRGEAGELAVERAQIDGWLARQRTEGLQLNEPGGYIQLWAAASAVIALAAWEDLAAHPDDPEAERLARAALGWWRDFGAYYGRLRTADGRLLRVGARQNHRPEDGGFDEVLLELLLGPAPEGRHPRLARTAGKPEREWRRRGFGAWAAREVMARGVPLAELAREGLDGPLPRIRNPVTLRPGRWARMPVVEGLGPIRRASWLEDGEVQVSAQPPGRPTGPRRGGSEGAPAWDAEGSVETGPAAPVPPLPELPRRPPARSSAEPAERPG